ncbi:Uncharacterized protein TCAP_02242 [Tolypocladium capitatum]|uniref:Tse2 ADP-ribosyltransferase toxin domain-containing protein n=1 Tax=Tolypocladium capitatum TaxID=45235 RepID=A0A2K3QK15_9HYPO|nr:Uncharacterized protein TCAP_02242 [Tolypocladium capitatum]
MPPPNPIAVFRKFPKELFRVNSGRSINLRVWSPQRHSYDILTDKGLVEAKALNPLSYAKLARLNRILAPNGASMRPNSPYQQSLVSWRFRGSAVIVYSVPEANYRRDAYPNANNRGKGTRLPDDLLLVHERSDHYSLQPAIPMTIGGKFSCIYLNARMTEFFRANAKEFTREEWLEAYPKATESSQFHQS